METVGYKLIAQDGTVVQQWGGVWGQCPAVPNPIMCPNGDIVHSPEIGGTYNDVTLVEWQMEEPTPPVPEMITRRQCAIEMRVRGMITAQEALEMTKNGTPPSMVASIFAQMPGDMGIIAETDFAAANYLRSNPLLVQLMQVNGASDAGIDDFFRSAATR